MFKYLLRKLTIIKLVIIIVLAFHNLFLKHQYLNVDIRHKKYKVVLPLDNI